MSAEVQRSNSGLLCSPTKTTQNRFVDDLVSRLVLDENDSTALGMNLKAVNRYVIRTILRFSCFRRNKGAK